MKKVATTTPKAMGSLLKKALLDAKNRHRKIINND